LFAAFTSRTKVRDGQIFEHDIEKFLARPGDVLSLVVEEDILRLEILKGLSRASIATLSREYELSRPL